MTSNDTASSHRRTGQASGPRTTKVARRILPLAVASLTGANAWSTLRDPSVMKSKPAAADTVRQWISEQIVAPPTIGRPIAALLARPQAASAGQNKANPGSRATHPRDNSGPRPEPRASRSRKCAAGAGGNCHRRMHGRGSHSLLDVPLCMLFKLEVDTPRVFASPGETPRRAKVHPPQHGETREPFALASHIALLEGGCPSTRHRLSVGTPRFIPPRH